MLSFVICCAIFAFILCGGTSAAPIPSVRYVPTDNNGNYQLTVNNDAWLNSGDTFVRKGGALYSTADGSLRLLNSSIDNAGTDGVGDYISSVWTWTAGTSATADVLTSIKRYYRLTTDMTMTVPPLQTNNVRAIIFDAFFPEQITGAATNPQSTTTSFPSWKVEALSAAKGFFQWSGPFAWNDGNEVCAAWKAGANVQSGLRAGPLLLFDQTAALVSVISPFSNFMDISVGYMKTNQVTLGVMGGVDTIPAGYSYQSIIYFSQAGVTEGTIEWGNVLLNRYKKSRAVSLNDMAIQYLGYSTGRGAAYYYQTIPGHNYQDTMISVREYILTKMKLPFHYYWYDSWFYYHYQNISNNGVINWTARPDIFPSGAEYVHQQTKLPIVAHNKWWAAQTSYAKQNGGMYDWLVEDVFSVPTDPRFWVDLFVNATLWGLHTYEQDWLYNEFEGVKALSTVIGLAKQWLLQMGSGAAQSSVTILYCMSLSRHLLQSVERQAVTSFRASDDYIFTTNQWRIGDTSLLGWSLAVFPFKDSFRTTINQPDKLREDNPDLQSVVATFSMAQVTPADWIDYMNDTMVMKSIRTDGLVLKPDRSAINIDATFAYRAFGKGVSGEVMHTYTALNGLKWHYFIVALSTTSFNLYPADVYESFTTRYVCWQYYHYHLSLPTLAEWNMTSPIAISPSARDDFSVWYTAPILSNGLVFIGETAKWTSVSSQRVTDMIVTAEQMILTLTGGASEPVTLSYAYYNAHEWIVESGTCQLSGYGQATVEIMANGDGFTCRQQQANNHVENS